VQCKRIFKNLQSSISGLSSSTAITTLQASLTSLQAELVIDETAITTLKTQIATDQANIITLQQSANLANITPLISISSISPNTITASTVNLSISIANSGSATQNSPDYNNFNI